MNNHYRKNWPYGFSHMRYFEAFLSQIRCLACLFLALLALSAPLLSVESSSGDDSGLTVSKVEEEKNGGDSGFLSGPQSLFSDASGGGSKIILWLAVFTTVIGITLIGGGCFWYRMTSVSSKPVIENKELDIEEDISSS